MTTAAPAEAATSSEPAALRCCAGNGGPPRRRRWCARGTPPSRCTMWTICCAPGTRAPGRSAGICWRASARRCAGCGWTCSPRARAGPSTMPARSSSSHGREALTAACSSTSAPASSGSAGAGSTSTATSERTVRTAPGSGLRGARPLRGLRPCRALRRLGLVGRPLLRVLRELLRGLPVPTGQSDRRSDAHADQGHADAAARDRRRERRGGLLVTGAGKTLHRTDDLVLPALRRVHGVDAIDKLIDVRCEVVLPAIGLAAHLVQALVLRHHCLRGSSGLARSDRIAA